MTASLPATVGSGKEPSPSVAATFISERKLRDAFQEQCGMGPIWYLKLRRLHEVRRTLRTTVPETASVKAVALANGFWELGRYIVRVSEQARRRPSSGLRGRLSDRRAHHVGRPVLPALYSLAQRKRAATSLVG